MASAGVDKIEACLPQTQCTRCSYPCCHDYAQALHNNEAEINQCPPGGEVSIRKLAALLDRPLQALNPEFGKYMPKTLAYIHEASCIGCVLCIQACPVDAIVGANKLMHTVMQAHCTGCELCIPVCPTDCIEMQEAPGALGQASDWPGYSEEDIRLGKLRHDKRQQRLKRIEEEKKQADTPREQDRQQAILDAVRRRQEMRRK